MNELTMEMTRKKDKFKTRVHEIDFLRGFLIILVSLDHLMWCLGHYGSAWGLTNLAHAADWYYSFGGIREIVRYTALFGFTFVSGVSVRFSKNTWRRTGLLTLVWFIIAVGSSFLHAIPALNDVVWPIQFNIIGVLAFCGFVYSMLEHRTNRVFWAVIGAVFLLWWYFIPYTSGVQSSNIGYINNAIQLNTKVFCPFVYDPCDTGHPQSDWLPLIPYLGFFCFGVVFSRAVYADKKSKIRSFNFERPVCFLGRHTFLIYIGFEAVILSLFEIINAIVKAGH